jgi:hypothetical protein
MTYTVFAASHADMENLADYDVITEAEGFTSRDAADAHAACLEESEGHSYYFWVLAAA